MNPALRELGYSASDRVVVVHADDIGMFRSSLPALEELMAFGLVTSASVMVPCPWIPEVVAWRNRRPDVDLGVHLTLTSEWDDYRWGPVATHSAASGLIDDQGCLHREKEVVCNLASRDAVRVEMTAQLQRAEQLGLAPTHIDNHMHVALCAEFVEDYSQLGMERSLPAFLPRTQGKPANESCRNRARQWETKGLPVFDCFQVVTGSAGRQRRDDQVRGVFDRLPTGLSCVLLHPALETDEIRQIAPDWRSRVADFEAFRNPSLRDHIKDLGIQLISYGPLREAMLRRLPLSS